MTTGAEQAGGRFVLRLPDIGELFEAPALDPFDPDGRTVSGLEEVVLALRATRRGQARGSVLTVVLPGNRITSDLPTRVRTAIDRFCTARIERAGLNKRVIRHEGVSKLRSELLVLPVAALVVALVLAIAPDLPPSLVQFLTPLVTITIWVAIWNPVDSLLFDRWQENRTIEIYGRIRAMDVVVLPAEDEQLHQVGDTAPPGAPG